MKLRDEDELKDELRSLTKSVVEGTFAKYLSTELRNESEIINEIASSLCWQVIDAFEDHLNK